MRTAWYTEWVPRYVPKLHRETSSQKNKNNKQTSRTIWESFLPKHGYFSHTSLLLLRPVSPCSLHSAFRTMQTIANYIGLKIFNIFLHFIINREEANAKPSVICDQQSLCSALHREMHSPELCIVLGSQFHSWKKMLFLHNKTKALIWITWNASLF